MNKPDQALRFVVKAAGAGLVAAVGAVGSAHAASVDNGKALVEAHNCAACHGATFTKPVSGEYPKLAGQHADYIVMALRQYQMGTSNPNFGRNNAIMQAQVQGLSLSDMKDIGAYLESLQGELVDKK
ncbi:cytochrome C [Trinickia dabaoshanensis]|uniref:Cytochrome C n=1 Tax=Trinickia dabaoshanensis TaxID=564714 RepID=A0A2N7VNS6_9BURK|nr:c-type cytochrome [Trinickia dabaoshanensis]PMS18811.1 cytochrome C [Trinickia dabaoshanensis]